MRTVLFICTGNTCRSPMAEAIARDIARTAAEHAGGRAVRADDTDTTTDGARSAAVETLRSIFVASAGVHAGDGTPVTREAIDALRRLGIEHSGTSKRLTGEMIRKADLVLAMTAAHVDAARRLVDAEADRMKVQLLDPDGDIDDPIGYGAPAYDAVARRLVELVPRRIAQVLNP